VAIRELINVYRILAAGKASPFCHGWPADRNPIKN